MKKLLSLCLALSAFFLGTGAFAGTLQNFSWTASDLSAGATGVTYEFSYVTETPVVPNDKILYFVFSSPDFDTSNVTTGDIVVTIDGITGTVSDFWNASTNGGMIELSQTVNSGSSVIVTVNDIGNPAAAGEYEFNLVRTSSAGGGPIDEPVSVDVDPIIISPNPMISSCIDFQNIENDLGGSYVLTQDINCVTDGNNVRLGSSSNQFIGTFDGSGYMIEINLQGTQSSVALFNFTSGATISNLIVSGTVLQNATNGGGVVAGVIGQNRGGTTTLTNVHFYGDVTMENTWAYAGGIVGDAFPSSMVLENVSFSGNLTAGSTSSIGGIFGRTFSLDSFTISGASVSGVFSGGSGADVGGITANAPFAPFSIHNSIVTADFSAVAVTANNIGGVVGSFNSCDAESRNTSVLHNNNSWPAGLEAFGTPCEGEGEGGGGEPEQPSSSRGGGGGGSLAVDYCPDGDNSGSYYDGSCGPEMSITERVVDSLVDRWADWSTAQVQQTLDTLSLLNDKIQEKESVSESMKTLFQDIIDGLLAHYNG